MSQAYQWHTLLRIKATFIHDIRDLWSHPCRGNWAAIRRAVECFARPAHAFSAGINCQHCNCTDGFAIKLCLMVVMTTGVNDLNCGNNV